MQLASDKADRTKNIFVNLEFNNLLPQHYFKVEFDYDTTVSY